MQGTDLLQVTVYVLIMLRNLIYPVCICAVSHIFLECFLYPRLILCTQLKKVPCSFVAETGCISCWCWWNCWRKLYTELL